MDEATFKEACKRITKVNKFVAELEPAIRAAAFEILRPFIEGDSADNDGSAERAARKRTAAKTLKGANTDDAEQFFSAHDHTKEADNVLLISAWLYTQYGLVDMTIDQVRQIADANGLSIPNTPSMTLKQSQVNGKHRFTKTTAGWRLTTPGERYLKATYNVSKGKKPNAAAAE